MLPLGPPPRPQDRKTVARAAQPGAEEGPGQTTDRISQNLHGGRGGWADPGACTAAGREGVMGDPGSDLGPHTFGLMRGESTMTEGGGPHMGDLKGPPYPLRL